MIKEEGMMTFLRKNIVCNARLIKCADGRGLRVRERGEGSRIKVIPIGDRFDASPDRIKLVP